MNHMQNRQWMILPFIALAILLAACTTPGAQAGPLGTSVGAQPTPVSTPAIAVTPEAGDEGCSLVYAIEGHVYCQRSFAVRQPLATVDGPFVSLALSQDGSFVAYTVMQDDGTVLLGVVRTDGSGTPLLIGAQQLGSAAVDGLFSPFQLQWRAGTHLLYFNTIPAFAKGEVDVIMLAGADLYAVNADSGAVKKVVERAGAGRFALSPDGKRAVLSLPQALELLDLETGERTHVLAFAPIDNATPTGYLPRADWNSDGTFFNVAIPTGRVFTADGTATLYRVSADGKVQTLGALHGSFMAGGPIEFEFSPDGTQVAYGTFDTTTQVATMHLALSDGTGDRVIDQIDRDHGLMGLGWSPDSALYIYSLLPDGGGVFARLISSGETFAAGKQVVAAKWTASDSFVYTDGSALYLYRPGEPMRQVVGGDAGGMLFDVRPEPAAPATAQSNR